MITMPIAGVLADKFPIGRIVPFGFAAIIIGVAGLALNTHASAPLWLIIAFLFIMGLGMGATMMPLFTSALKTLRPHQVARGTTLLNVIQQVGSSIGVATIAVILTANQNASAPLAASQAIAESERLGIQPPAWALETAQQYGDTLETTALTDLAGSFTSAYWFAAIALAVTLIPVAFMPRKREHRRGVVEL